MDPNRQTALEALIEIDQKQGYSNIALARAIERRKPTSPAFVRELVYGVLENKMYLDYILQHFVKTSVSGMGKEPLAILRAGLYQLIFMESVPDYAALDESVKAARKFDKGKDKFVNAVLRSYLREKDQISLPDREKDVTAYLTTRYSYDKSIVALWQKEFGDIKTVEALMAAGNEKPPLTIRVNLLKTTVEQLTEELNDEGFGCELSQVVPEALKISAGNTGRQKELTKTEAFSQGKFYIQDESSMLAVCLLDPKPGETIVDVCAAPGGKSIFIGERMENRGKIIACDIHDHKLRSIAETADRHGISMIETRRWDGTKTDETLFEKADRVLVDVPCSGLGVLRRHPEIKYKDYETTFSGLPAVQGQILRVASQYVKPGGVLVYSTCTISDAENFGVVNRFLEENQTFELDKSGILQLFPHIHHTDGFCVFGMRKAGGDKKEMTGRPSCDIM